MSDNRVEVIGWDRLTAAFRQVPAAVERAGAEAATDAAAMVVATGRARMPKRSGRLVSSVTARTVPEGSEVLFGAGVPYADWIEYGGTRWRPYVAQGRYLGAGRDDAERTFIDRAKQNTDDEVRRLPWP